MEWDGSLTGGVVGRFSVRWTQDGSAGMYQYFTKVVPTVYTDIRGHIISTNQVRAARKEEGSGNRVEVPMCLTWWLVGGWCAVFCDGALPPHGRRFRQKLARSVLLLRPITYQGAIRTPFAFLRPPSFPVGFVIMDSLPCLPWCGRGVR